MALPFLWIGKLTFSSPVATAEFYKFAGLTSAALSQMSPFDMSPSYFDHVLDFGTTKVPSLSIISSVQSWKPSFSCPGFSVFHSAAEFTS